MFNKEITSAEAVRIRDAVVRTIRDKSEEIEVEMLQYLADRNKDNVAYVKSAATLLSLSQITVWTREMLEIAHSGAKSLVGIEITDEDAKDAPEFMIIDSSGHFLVAQEKAAEALAVPVGSVLLGVLQFKAGGWIVSIAVVYASEPKDMIALRPELFQIGSLATEKSALYLAEEHFTRLPFAIKVPLRYSRAEVRQSQRKDSKAVLPEVKTIVLRKISDCGPKPQAFDGMSEARHYSCQWTVRGHWRSQFYPSLNMRRPKWINGYAKGPADKPMKLPQEIVYHVKR